MIDNDLDLFGATIKRYQNGVLVDELEDCDRLECVKQVINAIDYAQDITIEMKFKDFNQQGEKNGSNE